MRHLTGLRLPVLFAVLAFAVACGGGGSVDGDRESITFMAGFKPQANLPFVGVYVAQEKGFFDELGVDVEIRHAQSGEHLQLLLAGEVDVSTANAAQVVQRRAEGLPLRSIALIGQKSEQGFAVGADSGIESVSDWAGKRFGYKGTVPVEFLAIAEANGLDPDAVEQTRVGFDPRILSEGEVDILAVFISNEPGQLERIGYPVTVFDPSDFDIPVLGLTYITSEDKLEGESEALSRFLRGALRGIEYASNNVEEAIDIVLEYAPQEVREQQVFMLTTELGRAGPAEGPGYGWQTQAQWQALIDALRQYAIVTEEVGAGDVFTTDLLETVYEDAD
jgi:ABC-type nitrate/sulfonate/bicarbonate transport system substrate-binding protein